MNLKQKFWEANITSHLKEYLEINAWAKASARIRCSGRLDREIHSFFPNFTDTVDFNPFARIVCDQLEENLRK